MDRETEDKIQPMLADLGITYWSVTMDAFQDQEVLAETVVKLWERQKAQEAALDRLFPGWQMGPAACLPNCRGACCDMG